LGGAGRPVPVGGRVGCSIFTPDIVWERGRVRCMEAGAGMLKPAPDPPRCHV